MNITKKVEPNGMIDIPVFVDSNFFDRNQEKAYSNNLDHCPCCGKAITNPKYFINSIYGGYMYPKTDKNYYADSWVMSVGSECRKKLPKEYVMTIDEIN